MLVVLFRFALSSLPSPSMSDPHVQHAQSVLRSMEEQVAARLTAAQQHAPNSKPIVRLYRTLHDLSAQSEVYALDGDDARCYMMLSTTMRYYLSIIKKHPNFSDRLVAADKAKAQALCEKIMDRMEHMRAELLQQYEQESREAERDAKREAQQREEMAREQAEREQAAALAATFAPTSPSPTPPAVAIAATTALPPLQPPILPLAPAAAVSSDLPVSAAAPTADAAMGNGDSVGMLTDGGFTPSLNPFASLSSAAPPSSLAPAPEDSSLDAFANMEAAQITATPKHPAEAASAAQSSAEAFMVEPDAPMMDSVPAATAETEASAPPPPATSPYATAGTSVAGMAAIGGVASTAASAASAGASLAGNAAAGVAATAGAAVSALSSLPSASSSAAAAPSALPFLPASAAAAAHSPQPAATWTAPAAGAAASGPPPSVAASSGAVSGYPALQQKAAAGGAWPPPPPPLPASSAPPVAAATAKPRQRTAPPMPTTLRPIHLPSNVLGDFYAFAKANTDANIETCGILCGHLDEAEDQSGSAAAAQGFRITHVLIPNQTATADTCVTTNEEDLISLQMQYDLLTLGWIHTHPSQTCFLSSVDLHTHYTYQLMLPEAIAIVLAPRFQPNQGVFHCTLPGMKALTGCSRSGFHKHEEKFPLYSLAPHVCWENAADRKAKFIDLRTKRPTQPQPPQQPQQQQWRPPQQQPHMHSHPHPHAHHQPMMQPQQMQQRPMGFPAQPMQGYPQPPPPHQHRPGGPPHVHR